MSVIAKNIKELRLENNLSKTAFGVIAGMSGQGITDIEEGVSKDPRASSLIKIAEHFQVNLNWLLRGEGEKFKSNDHQIRSSVPAVAESLGMPKVIVTNPQGRENIVYVPVKARAGYLSGFGDPEYIESLPSYRLPGFDNGTYRMFEVAGKSMIPTVNNHDVVIGQWVESIEDIRDERVYVIVTKDQGIVIKRALNRVDSYGFVIAKSDHTNKDEYPNIDIEPEDIKELWYARAYMSNYFTAPSDLYTRMSNIEVELDRIKKLLPPKKE